MIDIKKDYALKMYENEVGLILKDLEHLEGQLARTKKRLEMTLEEIKKHSE